MAVTKQQLANEYVQCATQLGDREYQLRTLKDKVHQLEKDVLELHHKMQVLTAKNEAILREEAQAMAKEVLPQDNPPCGAV